MRFRKTVAAFLTISLSAVASFPYATAAGRSSTPAVNTILNGKGAPKSVLGIDGDFYIDTRSLLIYGPKSKGRWPSPKSIQGPTGPSGNDGRNGSDGKVTSNSNLTSIAGPQGPQGATGPAGVQGEKGEQGLPGATGPAGAPGLPGSAGPAGINGSNGAQGASGATGPAGAVGAKGETGTAGATKIIYGDLSFGDIRGSSGSGTDFLLSGFQANLSYRVNLHIYTYLPNDSTNFELPLSLSVTSTLSGAVVQVSYFLANGFSFRTGNGRYENALEGEVLLDGSSINVAYGITILVTSGRSTTINGPLKISGSFSAEEVQSVEITRR